MVLDGGVYGRCLGHKGEVLMNVINTLFKDPREILCPFCRRDIVKSWHLRSRKWTSGDTKSVGALILEKSAARTVKNKCLLFIKKAFFLNFIYSLVGIFSALNVWPSLKPDATYSFAPYFIYLLSYLPIHTSSHSKTEMLIVI